MQLREVVKDKAILSQKTTIPQWPCWFFLRTLSLGAMFRLLLCGDNHINLCINFKRYIISD